MIPALLLAQRRWGADATSPLGVRLAAWVADTTLAEPAWMDVEAMVGSDAFTDSLLLAQSHLLAHFAQLELDDEGGGIGAPIQSVRTGQRAVTYAVGAQTSAADAELATTAPGRAYRRLRDSRARIVAPFVV